MYQLIFPSCFSSYKGCYLKWCAFVVILMIIIQVKFSGNLKSVNPGLKVREYNNFWNSDDYIDFQKNVIRKTKSIEMEVYKEFHLFDILETKCLDALLAADPMTSTVELKGNNKIVVGDIIEFKVTLFDGYRRMKTEGGDHLRTRLYNDNLKAYANGDVVDHNNGSYTVTHNALWPGLAQVEIELLYPREVLAAMIRRRQNWNFRDIRAVYQSSNISESTHCHANKLKLTKYYNGSRLCKFAYWNNMLPWYCAKPLRRNFKCRDLKEYTRDWINYDTDLNECEMHLVNRDQYRIENIVNITVQQLKRNHHQTESVLKQCRSFNRSKLWFLKQPSGYFYKGKWILRHCKGFIGNVGECFRNTTVYFWGDSTILQWYMYLRAKLNLDCTNKSEDGGKWYNRQDVYCQQYKLWLIYIPHNIPGTACSTNTINYFSKPPSEQMQTFRKTSKRIIIIHIYAHLQVQNIQYFISNVLALRKDLERLVIMNNTRVFIKLPHTHRQKFIKTWVIRQPDFIGLLYESIIQKVFTGMHKSVIALNHRDMTIAFKNIRLHPSKTIVSAMVDQLSSYVCDK